MSPKPSKALRCAIYTRVSTEYGLEQEFNSLDAQREACEAYIASQKHEGWGLLPTRYDDGGFSGGSMDRPALQRLLADIRSGRIDVVVVYKVDRLTRSLTDFAKLVELFDQHDVSFVSVTQSFNTTSSMGRLTLNVLLSFAQFEREVTGERIRDKIAASKKKGMRVGGPVPLGYAVKDKKLVIDTTEADHVRLIFRRYLELGCLTGLARDLREQGIVTKVSLRRDGSTRGGIPFSKGSLAYLLRNRVYVGEVVHKGQYYPGEHAPILTRELFDAVQQALSSRDRSHGARKVNRASPLTGRLFDDRGNRMTPTSTNKGGVRYRYYTSCVMHEGRREEAGAVARVPAPEIEAAVLQAHSASHMLPKQGNLDATSGTGVLLEMVERVVVKKRALEIQHSSSAEHPAPPIVVTWSPPARARREVIMSGGDGTSGRPIRAETRARLLDGIARARVWLDDLVNRRVRDTSEIAVREGCSERSVRMTLNLAFLSPALVKAAIEGTLPDGLGLTRLNDLPAEWAMQNYVIGTSATMRVRAADF